MSFGFSTLYSEARSYVGQNGWSKQQEDQINARLADVLWTQTHRTFKRTLILIGQHKTRSFFFHGALRPQKPQGLLGTGKMRWGKRDIIYLSLHCHHQNDSCIKISSDESHFNVSLIVRDKVTRQCPQTITFEERGEPKRNRPQALLLTSLTARPIRLTASSSVLSY